MEFFLFDRWQQVFDIVDNINDTSCTPPTLPVFIHGEKCLAAVVSKSLVYGFHFQNQMRCFSLPTKKHEEIALRLLEIVPELLKKKSHLGKLITPRGHEFEGRCLIVKEEVA